METVWVAGSAVWLSLLGLPLTQDGAGPQGACFAAPPAAVRTALARLERVPVWGVFFRSAGAGVRARLAQVEPASERLPVPASPRPLVTRPRAPFQVKTAANFPDLFKRENGRLVCTADNDKPRKSKRGKGKHMDMECCLDPDETPNPHCYYPPEKYGHLLKKFL